ncbi:hypothetical protein F5J12DRAFT_947380 [Pisolithus orientalis]|uniref:uncharacterized protein n=1 Tax=Pisolithus orientalis TaxID=936130 RepID=UPI0022256A2C|nr:uncharacterized protein F5J12DRAFT_947380 [Pisolithus orientalis]KAI6002576.1 hypothetical protein F5J12DRAFT_947380 [Pisolithus orientalis]
MSTTNTSTFILAQSTDNIQPVITTENAKWMVEEAARVTMQALRGLWGWDAKHWGKVAQLVWAQLGMVCMVVEHLLPAFKIPLHLIAINMHMVDLATIFAMQMWLPFNQMMMAQEADMKDHAWYCLHHQPKSHPYYKVMAEFTRPLSRAKHEDSPWIRGRGKSWVQMRLKGFSFQTADTGSEDAPTDTTARTTMALAPGWHSWHWCWDSLTDGLIALGMCWNSLQWCCDSLHDGLMALGMCQNIWHRCQDSFHGIGVVPEHITVVLG